MALPSPIKIEIEPLEKARDPFRIHLHYPAMGFEAPAKYNSAAVTIELSGRAEGWPMEERTLSPYAAQQFPDIDPDAVLTLSCVKPERTFWEKCALVHEQNIRPGNKPVGHHQARHLYDLAKLWETVRETNGFHELFDGVIAHRRGYFDYTWVDFDKLSTKSLKLVPPGERLPEWQDDYAAMEAMFFKNPPGFEEIIATLLEIEKALSA